MRCRALILIAMLLATTSCSYHYAIAAVEQAGKIVFLPKDEKGTGCFSDFSVQAEGGPVVWELSIGRYLPPPCDNKFPITYGAVPAGMTEKVKAVPLQAGTIYVIEGWDGDSYSGRFRFKRSIVIDNLPEQR